MSNVTNERMNERTNEHMNIRCGLLLFCGNFWDHGWLNQPRDI